MKAQTHKYLDCIFMRSFCIPPPRKSFVPNKGDWNDLKKPKKVKQENPFAVPLRFTLLVNSVIGVFIHIGVRGSQ